MTQSDTTNTQGKGDSPSNPYEAAKAKFAQETSQFEDRRALELNGITPTDKVVMTGKYPAHTGKMDIDFVSPPQGLPIDGLDEAIHKANWEQAKLVYAREIEVLITERERVAYKKGYAQGGVDTIVRHDKATQELLAELNQGKATDPADI